MMDGGSKFTAYIADILSGGVADRFCIPEEEPFGRSRRREGFASSIWKSMMGEGIRMVYTVSLLPGFVG